MARKMSQHTEWLSLVEVSGPFLAVSVLEKEFPQSLEKVDTPIRRRLRAAYAEWRQAIDENDPLLSKLHEEWIWMVLRELLEFDDDILLPNRDLPKPLFWASPERSGSFSPDFVLSGDGDNTSPRLLVSVQKPGRDLDTAGNGDGWSATIIERMVGLCRSVGTRIGLVTNGERWVLVNAPVGSTAGHASWYAGLWFQEPITLRSFQSLFGVRRFFGPEEEGLPALLEKSLEAHEEVTDTLGEQVRRAVEVLIQSLDKADQDRNRELLREVSPAELYEAGLTVMMRLVFVLCAEERGLLLLGDPVYDRNYAVSTLRAQLAEEADRHGPEVLERRHDAWTRLLAVFRAVYGGIDHETLRMPALGGSLFDPDRFPFLEGRAPNTRWRDTEAKPLPIDNRTVLLLLEALQILEQKGGALLLSYKALDVEQIGHVYEGLLEHTVRRLPDDTIGLAGTKKTGNPNVALAELESAYIEGVDTVAKLVKEKTGKGLPAIKNALKKEVDEAIFGRIVSACGGDVELAQRIEPFAHFLRTDAWGDFIVYRAGSFAVTSGLDRRETGTHYTPKSLTETIVETTLEPIAYIGPAEGIPRDEWQLKSSAELLDLKICDPAMGSGAFLVQVCRWLSERLVEAWDAEANQGKFITVDGATLASVGSAEPMPESLDERLLIARRLVAEKCLYGVDLNPLAVELAKLSIWLVTLAKGRPFGFLDHNLRSGDSLLGIHRLDQLTKFSMDPRSSDNRALGAREIESVVADVVELRKQIRQIPIRDIQDVENMKRLNREANNRLQAVTTVADAMIGCVLAHGGKPRELESHLKMLSVWAGKALVGEKETKAKLQRQAKEDLSVDRPGGRVPRKPFHWPLIFPEVFEKGGFDGIVGNPPFMGGQRISGAFGKAYREYLVRWLAEGNKGSADLVAYFYLRAFDLLRQGGDFGLLAVNTIAEGDTRQVGLERLIGEKGAVIYAAYPNEPWPGKAAVVTSRVHVRKGKWRNAATLSGRKVAFVSAFLSDQEEWTPKRLKANTGKAFQGSIVLGMGFVLSEEEALGMIEQDPKNQVVLFPYLNGRDLNNHPEQKPSRWVINFWDWPEEKAKEYEIPYEIILKKVKPERQRRKPNGKYKLRKPLPQRWWQYGEKRPGLYHTIGRGHAFIHHPDDWTSGTKPMERVLVIPETTKYCLFSLCPTDIVFSHMTKVIALQTYEFMALMNSAFHEIWVRKYSSTLETRLKYITSDAFETFPFPSLSYAYEIRELGKRYYDSRTKIMQEERIGLTTLYNRLHDPDEDDPRIQELRDLHRQIDEAVAEAYGWDDLELEHGFHEVDYLPENDRIRWTISEKVRLEVLRRLARLNKERYEEEVRQGLHGGRENAVSRKIRGGKVGTSTVKPLLGGISTGPEDAGWQLPKAADPGPNQKYPHARGCVESKDDEYIRAILAFLEANPGWHAKSAILDATDLSSNRWKAVIDRLMGEGIVVRQGERRGARYTLKKRGESDHE